MMERNRRWVLASRPRGWVRPENFCLEDAPLPQLSAGQVLVRNHFLSLDPYMRGRMSDAKSYAKCVEIGGVMVGATVGEVVASRNSSFAEGDAVIGSFGWQLYGVCDGATLHKVNRRLPLSAYLGVLGMPGVTAYVGLLDICLPKGGETVVVTAASGAVGSAVGQIARMRGCRVVGIAGGSEKCRHVVEELGFDACIDYKAGPVLPELVAATPKGIDCCFENVGGEIFDAILSHMNAFGRIALCGLVSQYNLTEPYGYRNLGSVLMNRLKVEGFIVGDRLSRWPVAQKDLAGWVSDGRIRYHETVAEGLEAAPEAFIGMLQGRNLGKQLVRLVAES